MKLDLTKNDAFMRTYAQKRIHFMLRRIFRGTNPSKPPRRRRSSNSPSIYLLASDFSRPFLPLSLVALPPSLCY